MIVVLAVLGCSGCYESPFPIDSVPRANVEPALIGVWRCTFWINEMWSVCKSHFFLLASNWASSRAICSRSLRSSRRRRGRSSVSAQ